jgi:aspartate carbamoyltransferase catalytic subunit
MSTPLTWNRKDLIAIEPLTREEIETIFAAARAFKGAMDADRLKQPYLNGRTVVNLFLEPSTRTRLAFEVAANQLSADTLTMTAAASSLTKGETLRDTAQNMQALLADVIILRHASSGAGALPQPSGRYPSDQCRRWFARTPDASPARLLHASGKMGPPGRKKSYDPR